MKKSQKSKKRRKNLTVELTKTAAIQTANINSIVEDAKEIMSKNLHRTLNIEELAGNLYVSYAWFRQAFKEVTGEPPAEYHLRLRIELAKKLLNENTQTIKEISEQLGFKTQNHFSALFKQKIEQFRKSELNLLRASDK